MVCFWGIEIFQIAIASSAGSVFCFHDVDGYSCRYCLFAEGIDYCSESSLQ